MTSPKNVFSLKPLMSKTPEFLGEIEWLSRKGVEVKVVSADGFDTTFQGVTQDAVLFEAFDVEMAAPKKAIAHGLTEGSVIYLAGVGFEVDGFYQVKAATETEFTIALEAEVTGPAMIYGLGRYRIHYPDKLSGELTAELKRLQDVDRFRLQLEQSESATKAQSAMEMITRFGINIETGEADRNAVEALVQNNPAAFLQQLSELDLGALVDLQATRSNIMKESDAIARREIEIVCNMPHGHMDLMCNFPGISDTIQDIYELIKDLTNSAVEEPEVVEADTEKKSQKRSPKQKQPTESI